MNKFPTIDGHFWVVRDGKIIDPDFDMYHFIKKMNNCRGKTEYLPADKIVQDVMIKIFQSVINDDDLYSNLKKYNHCATFGRCYQNAIYEIKENGGELVFGSMGWKFRKSQKIHWEYGGENWTVHQFLKIKK